MDGLVVSVGIRFVRMSFAIFYFHQDFFFFTHT